MAFEGEERIYSSSRWPATKPLALMSGELKNFQDIAKQIVPRPEEIPMLDGIDIYGGTLPLNGIIGGDHIIYVDFKRRFDLQARMRQARAEGRLDVVENLERCQRKAGMALLDVAGHHATDAMLVAMLHQAFLLGSMYELDMFGHITRRLFENINTRFYNPASLTKFATMIYGEISEDATFRFLSAAHPPPVVFSYQHDRFMDVSEDLCTSFPPIGVLPSKDVIDRSTTPSILGFKDQYRLNEWRLMGKGDILLLYTDGFLDDAGSNHCYFPQLLEKKIREVKSQGARDIFEAVKTDYLGFTEPSDDISLVVIKRT